MRMVSASAAAAPALLAFAFAGAMMPAIAVAADNPPPDVPPASQGSARPRAPVAPADDITLALAVGFLTTFRLLGQKPLPVLRRE